VAEYNPKQLDSKWQHYWEENKTFKVNEPKDKKFYCLDMFPYPSGSGLHVGHPLGYTATDICCRYKRMQGYSVLHPMGFDAFGLPAEQHAVQTGEHPAVVTKQNCDTFTRQLKTVGLSYDWDRDLKTCTEDYYHWTQWIFLKLYNSWFDDKSQKARPISELDIPAEISSQGILAIQAFQADRRLAYYAEAMVNWCPALGTVLANEEVIDGKSERGGHPVERKPMKQWMLRITKYSERLISELEEIDWPENIKDQQRNWIGKKHGAEIEFKVDASDLSFRAFTTRPDTLFGVTFFVISPEHPFVDKVVTTDRKESVEAYKDQARKLSDLARTMDNREKTGVFSGTYLINPINSEKIPLFIGDYVLISVGTGAVMGVPAHDERDFEFAKKFNLEIRPVLAPEEHAARPEIISGNLVWTESGKMLASPSAVAQELKLEDKTNSEASDLICTWLEQKGLGKRVVTYKLRDWLFSRQRYWGEPIPIIHWEDGSVTAVEEDKLPLVLPEVADYKPSDGGESPLAKATEWLKVIDPVSGKKGRRETNTMPQWAGSCWYYLRFIDPKNPAAAWDPELEKAWMPVDLYVGGAEHAVLHLLYARFWHKVLFDLGYVSTKEPFKKLFNQGMVLAHAYKNSKGALVPIADVEELEDGSGKDKTNGEILERFVAKMSKSLRNVVSLDYIVDGYGADTFRLYLMFMGPLDASRPWDSKAISGVHRFLKKIWNLFISNSDESIREFVDQKNEDPEVTKAGHRLVERVTRDIEAMQFNTAIAGMMEFLNALGSKPFSRETATKIILVLSPFAPHLAEELWQKLGNTKTLSYEPWPVFDPSLLKQDKVTVVVQVNGKKRATLDVDVSISDQDLKSDVITKLHGTDYAVSDQAKFITVRNKQDNSPKLVSVTI
jgi:leucyl-tRNA synthetase